MLPLSPVKLGTEPVKLYKKRKEVSTCPRKMIQSIKTQLHNFQHQQEGGKTGAHGCKLKNQLSTSSIPAFLILSWLT